MDDHGRARLVLASRERAAGRRTRGRRLQRLLRGVYLRADQEPELTHLCAAAVVMAPADAVVVGVTALWLHGVEVGSAKPVRLATATSLRRRTAGIRLSRVGRLPRARNRVAVPAEAWVSACGELALVDAVVAADWLLWSSRITPAELAESAASASGRGARIARRAAGLARRNVASPKETELRLLLVLAGLPEPRCNVAVGDAGRRIAEVDLYYEAYRVVVEYEGDHHRTDGWQWSVDIERYEALIAAGYVVVRVTAARMSQPRALLCAVLARLRDRGYDGPPPTFTAEWRDLFEG
ncbi:hypothetical protein [Microlunatus speluncae]|uniref:hypothetical protein n=1 Tax=Microlunatus speluncae TaxID=2594267 RepID=UPI00126617C8|nr:hypothetical protein [Microlunatus speluncae]